MEELVDNFMDKNKIYHLEGDSGLDKLGKIIQAIGYSEHGLRHGSIIEVFLTDNPGACEAIVNFIKESNVDEWRELLDEWRESLELECDYEDEESEE